MAEIRNEYGGCSIERCINFERRDRDKYRSDTKLLASAASSMLLKEIYGGAAQ